MIEPVQHVQGYLDLMSDLGNDGSGQEENFILSLSLSLSFSLSAILRS